MSVPDRACLNDFCSKGLLRRFRPRAESGGTFRRPRVGRSDIDEMLLRWSLSSAVRRLAEHVIEYPREAKSSIDFVERRTQGEISGTVDARATLLEQAAARDPTLFVVSEPSASFHNGPNHLVAWTLREAEESVVALLHREKKSETLGWVHDRARLLDSALRNQTLRDVFLSPAGRARPNPSALRSAARSRTPLYRLALEAFEAYEGIESLDPETLRRLMEDTMLSPLEDWQLLELSAALAVADAVAVACGGEPVARAAVGGERVVADAGAYSVLWQKALPQRPDDLLDPGEVMAREIARSIGSDTASSRVDVCVIQRETGEELAHVECKWFQSELSLSGAISDAATQIVRYARDSRPTDIEDAKILLADSLIVVASRGDYAERADGSGPVGFTDFRGLEAGSLDSWADAFVMRHG